jgi:hypothetical protein
VDHINRNSLCEWGVLAAQGQADLPFIIFHFSSSIAEKRSDEFGIQIL